MGRTRMHLRPSTHTCRRDESGWCSDVTSTHPDIETCRGSIPGA